ncbi:MAG: phosphatase PAP2 family protein [Rhodobacteraceae bacterium]|nr:phosphatase PAP2 family protein [Paracoccaceae bacterium]
MTDPLFTRLTIALLAVTVLAQTLFATWPGIDLALSRALTDDSGHFIAKAGVLPTLNATLRTIMELGTFLTIATSLVLAARGRLAAEWQRLAAFFGLALVLVPGVIVNVILKSHVGRARPETVTEFGGSRSFTPPWQVGDECASNCSFTSGEVALAATWGLCLTVWLWPHLSARGKTWAIAAAMAFVTLVSLLRMALGRHFLSDAVFSTLFAGFVALALYRVLNIGSARLACPPQDLLLAARQAMAHLPERSKALWWQIKVLSGVVVVPQSDKREAQAVTAVAHLGQRLGAIARARPWLLMLAVALFALVVFLPGFASLPVTDRDEARFVQASRQMMQSGDLVDIRFQDQPRHKKPVGIYWLQSAAVAISGQGDQAPLWVYRLPSLIGAVLAVVLVAAIGLPLVGAGPALVAAVLFAATLVIGGEARIAKTDAALLASILATQAVLARLWTATRPPAAWLAYAFWGALGVGVLIKGPMALLVPGFTVLVLSLWQRKALWMQPLARRGPIVLALALVLPWVIAITIKTGGAFWAGSMGADLLPKMAAGQEGKGAPPGTHALATVLTLWPATAVLILALPRLWHARRDAATVFLLAWLIPSWLVFEAVPTKLLHYTLPMLPALALLAALHAPAGLAAGGRVLRAAATLALLPGLALGGAALWGAFSSGAGASALLPLGLGMTGATLAAAAAAVALWQQRFAALVLWSVLTGAALHMGLFAGLARVPALWPSTAAVDEATRLAVARGCTAPRLVGWGYTEPSLVWLGQGQTLLLPSDALPPDAATDPCLVVVRPQSADSPLPQGYDAVGLVEGMAIGAGRWVTLDLLMPQEKP